MTDKTATIDLTKELAHLAELGRTYPAEFISALAETAADTLDNWIRAQPDPAQALDLLQDVLMLHRCEVGACRGPLADLEARELVLEVGPITGRIAALGGVFYTADGPTPARE